MTYNKRIFKHNDFEFINYTTDSAEVFFSTANNGIDFNKSTEIGLNNIDKIKEIFDLEDICYLNQIHSDYIHTYDRNIVDGDGLITDKKRVGVGVFTADCVSVIIYDNEKKVCSSVHSGWKGTYKGIVIRAVDKMVKEYGCSPENMEVFIGPHARRCCYEVGNDLIEKFKALPIFKNEDINTGRNIDLNKCIEIQLLHMGIKKEKINDVGECTMCSDNYKLHSYRKDKDESGRMFSFIYLK